MTRFLAGVIEGLTTKRRLYLGVALLLLVWVALFDSHSIMQRVRLHRQQHQLQAANAQLESEIRTLQETMAAGLSRADIERLARTRYGMSRPGEVVHPIQEKDSP